MKRKDEISIIVNSLLKEGLIDEKQSDRARSIVGGSIKTINARKYSENHQCPLEEIKESISKEMRKIENSPFPVDRKPTRYERIKVINFPVDRKPTRYERIKVIKSGAHSALVVGDNMVDLTAFQIEDTIVGTTLILKIVCNPNELEIVLGSDRAEPKEEKGLFED